MICGFFVNWTTFPNVQIALSKPDGLPCIMRSDKNAHDEIVFKKYDFSSSVVDWLKSVTNVGVVRASEYV